MALFDILANSLPSEAEAYGTDPFYQAGKSVAGWQLKPQTSAEAIYMPAIQGLLQGILTGYGQREVNEDLYDQYKKLPSMQSILMGRPDDAAFGPLTSADAAIADTPMYSFEDAPEGWKPSAAKAHYIQSLIEQQSEQEVKDKIAVYEAANTYGSKAASARILEPEEVDVWASKLGLTEDEKATLKTAGDVDRISRIKNLDLQSTPSTIRREFAKSKSVVDEARLVASKLKVGEDDWASMQLARNFSGMDKDGIQRDISQIADRFLRSQSGMAAPLAEKKELYRIAAGDFTAGPKQAAMFLEKFASSIERDVKSQAGLLETLKSDGLGAAAESFNAPSSPAVAAPPGPPAAGMKWQHNQDFTKWRQVPK